MTEWKPEAGKDAVVRVVGPSPNLEGFWNIVMPHSPSGVFTVHHSALRPLPTALSAEDAAVLQAADRWAGDFIREGGARDFMSTEAQNLISAVERRRRSTPPAAVAQEGGPEADEHYELDLEGIRERGNWRALEEADMAAEATGKESLRDVPQDSAWVPKAGDRIRHKGTGILGTVAYVDDPPSPFVRFDNGNALWMTVDDLEIAPPRPDTTALRDAVVEAAKEQAQRGVELANARGGVAEQVAQNAYTQACGETNTRGRALLAAEAPPDPVTEAKAAFAQLEDELMVAPGPVMDRLRAALDALLSLLAERGWQVVPVVATEEMYSVEHSPLLVLGAAGNTRVQQWRSGIFRAMCAAAPAPLSEETPHAR